MSDPCGNQLPTFTVDGTPVSQRGGVIDIPAVPLDIVVDVYADAAARNAAVPSPADGEGALLADVGRVTWYDGSAWVDPVDDWRTRAEVLSETGLSDTFTTASGVWTPIGSNRTFTPPAAWNTYELTVAGTLTFGNTASGTASISMRLDIDGNKSGGANEYVAAPSGGAVTHTESFLPATQLSLSGAINIRPEFWVGTITNSPTLSMSYYFLHVVAERTT